MAHFPANQVLLRGDFGSELAHLRMGPDFHPLPAIASSEGSESTNSEGDVDIVRMRRGLRKMRRLSVGPLG